MSLFLFSSEALMWIAILLTMLPVGPGIPEGHEDDFGFHFGPVRNAGTGMSQE